MKKKILFLIALLVPFLVSAKEELSYGWDYENENGAVFAGEKNNEYLIGENVASLYYGPSGSAPQVKLSYFSPAGKKLRSVNYESISDAEMLEIDELMKNKSFHNYISITAGEEVGLIYPYDEELLICPNYEAYFEEDDSCVWKYFDELTDAETAKYITPYQNVIDLYERFTNSNISIRRVGNLIIVDRYEFTTDKEYYEVYDADGKRLVSQQVIYPYKFVSIDANIYGIYILTEEIDYENKTAAYELIKYDLKGKKEYTVDFSELVADNSSYEDLYYYLNYQIATVNGGLVVNLGVNFFAQEMDECIEYFNSGENPLPPKKGADDEDPYTICKGLVLDENYDPFVDNVLGATLDGDEALTKGNTKKALDEDTGVLGAMIGSTNSPAYYENFPTLIIKLNLDYEVATKVVEGKGTIKAINRSASGEGVTFVVEPAPGYVLSVVKVTDALGNVIEFTDYTFTMPSSDVLIEAVFVKENPNTADIAIVTVISLAIVFGIVLLNVNKKYRWLK